MKRLQCETCVHSRRNTGRFVSVSTSPFFCLATAGIHDAKVVELLNTCLLSLAELGVCQQFERYPVDEDAYVSGKRRYRDRVGAPRRTPAIQL